jgi:Fe2+ or Zn2+ uptake regulation protein
MADAIDDRVTSILGQLRSHGGRATAARRATITVLLEAPRNHLSSEDIIREVRARQPEVAESTVYRALAALEDLGVVEHVHLGHGPSTYHLTGQAHQHLVCRQCGRVVEVPDSEFAELSERLSAGYGFEIDPRHFAILGRCRHCRSRRRNPATSDAGPA